MNERSPDNIAPQRSAPVVLWVMVGCSLGFAAYAIVNNGKSGDSVNEDTTTPQQVHFEPRRQVDSSGYSIVERLVLPVKENATLSEIAKAWDGLSRRGVEQIDKNVLSNANAPLEERFSALSLKAVLLNYEGNPKKAFESLARARLLMMDNDKLSHEMLYSLIYLQGVTCLRRGENENCIMCRGESSCILPISSAAVHMNPEGSRLAIQYFTEYLTQFPEDLPVRWLLNIAHMTLGEYPEKVDPRFLLSLDNYLNNEFNIGRFRDIGHIVGVNQFTQAGGAIMEDFDNDGLLDIAITSFDPTCHMNLLRNSGEGTFDDVTIGAGLENQLGGLNCVQTDYNNDGWMDIFIIRGAWVKNPMRPTLLRNNKDGTFADVTEDAGLQKPGNSIAASWADYDNDGWLDLFVCCEQQPSRLYHNLGNGSFEEVAIKAGLFTDDATCKGVSWVDYDNDDFPDLFLNFLGDEPSKLFHNNRDGTFQDATYSMKINGPTMGFSCWAWDYDNDGWLDIFATCYDRSLEDVVKGLLGQPHGRRSNRLYRNNQGRGFDDVTKKAGLDLVFSTMGSNFGDFDNDGFLDMYLGTGEPDLATLIPNRMFKNVAGQRFSEITATSGTGHLQKGHGVACGDWDRDGNTDIFIEMGGAVNGDKYHNILFQNPGHNNNWLTVKLIGNQSNRPAIGARIKVVTDGESPQEFYRHISSGSSFGANPLQQTIGLGRAARIATLEIHWPTSKTTQVFRDVAVNQAISIKEFDTEYQKLDWTQVPIPELNKTPKMKVAGN